MAQLIPSFMDEQTPPGERDVFNLLAAGPDSWVALHSLDLAPWNRGLRTEIDFVVIVPDSGILCIEVKSHQHISFDGYRWFPETIKRSPFKQAADGRHTFYRRLAELAPQFRHVPVVHCCIFPRSRFNLERNLSVQSWELMDARTFMGFRSGIEFCGDLKSKLAQSIEADSSLSRLSASLRTDQVDSIVRFCMPIQKRRPDARAEVEQRERETEQKLLEQQRPVLKLAALNERLVVSGGAGTGKTLIAMEVARREAEAGQRVALVCFNHLVGNWIHRRIAELQPTLPQLVAGRAVRILADLSDVDIPRDPPQQFWDVELPRRIEERFTDPDFRAAAEFDYLVVDEAQDILARPWIWGCLRQIVAGGARTGRIALFGDFISQVLADRNAVELALSEFKTASQPVSWALSENCRNYRIVGDAAVRLSGMDPAIYSGYLRAGGGFANLDIRFYDDDRTQLDQIAEWLRDFKARGYKASEVTILSFAADQLSAAVRLNASGFKLRPERLPGTLTGYCSVQAFKGMENKVVILTDVSLQSQDIHRTLFYTGITRATEVVRILCHRESRDALLQWADGDTSE